MSLIKLEIPTRSRRCSRGNENFEQGTEYISVLEESSGQGFSRSDYCVSCWEKNQEDPNFTSFGRVHWKSRVPQKKMITEAALKRDEKALMLLKELSQADTANEASKAFVLALLLQRKKKLQLKQEVPSGEGYTILLFEVMETEEMLGVRKVDLSSIQADTLQQELAEMLAGSHSSENTE